MVHPILPVMLPHLNSNHPPSRLVPLLHPFNPLTNPPLLLTQGGVNTTRDYAELMTFGHWTGSIVHVDKPLLQGGIVAVYYLPGTLIGALWGGWLGDRYGRIFTIAFATLWAIVGAALQCSAMNADWMFCARVFNGVGTGILNAITPVWATETASHTSRGAFVAMEFTLNILGVVVAYWLE